ncbi:MAG: hypothetical protein PHE38_16260 [Alishewanella agri]|nr:hypothetical protein [Alishewanella agri]
MNYLHTTLLFLHILLGAICLMLFWVPVVSAKGSMLHNTAGALYYKMMLFIAGSGVLMCLMVLFSPTMIYGQNPNWTAAQLKRFISERRVFSFFLFQLSLLTWVTVRHAYGVLKVKAELAQLRVWSYQGPVWALLVGSVALAIVGFVASDLLSIIFSGVGAMTVLGILRYIRQPTLQPRQWIIEHFTSMIGTGIALYTAFFAAGGRRLLAEVLTGQWQVISWVIAPVMGISAIMLFKRHFSRKFRIGS